MGDLPGHAKARPQSCVSFDMAPLYLGVIADGGNNSLSADPAPHFCYTRRKLQVRL